MKRVLKYPIPTAGLGTISTHRGAVPLHVDFQRPYPEATPELMLWAIVDDQELPVDRGVVVVMTGEGPPPDGVYVGTATTTVYGQPYVAHVFVQPEP
jgi:hypothetical protein